ncbi:MAG: ATP-binding protein [Bacteroidota bacterium]
MATNERTDHLEHLLEVVRGLTTAPDLDAFLQTIISEATELTNSELSSILEYDGSTEELRFLAMQWFERDLLRPMSVPLEGSAAGWVFRKAQPLIIQDVRADQRHFKVVDQATKHSTHSLVAVPLIVRGEVVGVLEALNKKDDAHYTEEDLIILETLAALAAQAIKCISLSLQVNASRVQLVELERLKSDFIAITSHELRTPIGLILGHATFVREQDGGQFTEQLDAIIKNATRLKEIVENISSVDNYQNGLARVKGDRASMTQIAEETVAIFRPEAEQKNINLRLETVDQPFYVYADRVKLAIALSNLVKNAIQYTEPGGQVTVKVGEDTGYIKVSVTDNGIGIPARELPRIFDRFYQVETHLTRHYGGMGLGLSVAKAMIELHGGRIWAESQGKGSTFTFLLPVNLGADITAPDSPFVP